jgi:hypothetical protein
MRFSSFALCLSLAACGDSTTSTSALDASNDQGTTGDSAGSDGAVPDGGSKDSSPSDSSMTDSSIPYEAGALDMCNPNDPTSCGQGQKCCSEPTHKMPPSAYICVTPNNGACPMFP